MVKSREGRAKIWGIGPARGPSEARRRNGCPRGVGGAASAGRFTFSVHTERRWSERAGLRWRDVDALTGTITVLFCKNGTTRRVPMTSAVRSTITDVGATRQRPNDPSERLFDDSYRQTARLFGQAIERAQAILQAAGKDASRLDGYTWHSNRHTFASRLAMAGVDPRDRPGAGWVEDAKHGGPLQSPFLPPPPRGRRAVGDACRTGK